MIRKNRSVSVILLLTFSLFTFGTCKDCLVRDMCSCGFDDGSGFVDLTSLGNTDKTPRFKDVLQSAEGYYYSYNPCGGFSEGSTCKNAAVCVLNEDKTEQMQIGDMKPSRVSFKYDDDAKHVIAAYAAGSGVLQLSSVNLICDKSACDPTFLSLGQQGASQYEMTLTTICACPGMCTASGPVNCKSGAGAGGISGGSILLIIFGVAIIGYLVVGVLFMKFKKQANGTDLIIHKDFWTSIPGLVVTGFKFLINKCRRGKGYGSV